MKNTQQKEKRSYVATLLQQGNSDKDVAIKYTQLYGEPITIDQVRHFRETELPRLVRKAKRQEVAEDIKDDLGTDEEALRKLQMKLMERIDDEPNNRELVALVKEARGVIMTKHELAANVDPGKAIFVIQINGEEVASNREQVLAEDAEYKILPQPTEGTTDA